MAAGTNGGIIGAFSGAGIINPTTFAFCASGPGNQDPQPFQLRAAISLRRKRRYKIGLGDDEKVLQLRLIIPQKGEKFFRSAEGYGRLERIPDELILPGNFQGFGDFSAHLQEKFPAFFELVVEVLRFHLRKEGEVHALSPGLRSRHVPPDLFRGIREDRSHEADKGIQDLEEGSLRCPALPGRSGGSVETVLQDVQVKGAQVHRTEVVQGMKNQVKFKICISFP
jgi:hypothetical protein